MEFLKKNDLSSFSIIASCIIHILLFIFIFIIAMHPDINRLPSSKNSSTNKKPSPIIFRQPISTPQKQAPSQIPAQKEVKKLPEPPLKKQLINEEIAQAELPGSKSSTLKKQQSLAKKMIKKVETLTKPLCNFKDEEKKNLEETIKSSAKEPSKEPTHNLTTLLESTEIQTLFTLPKPTLENHSSSINTQKNQTITQGQLRKNKLTLADLFKNLSSSLDSLESTDEKSQDGDINGEMLVINQGDMKYYSFLQKFVTHINQVFTFHGGPNQAKQWAQGGFLKNNTNLTIIIDKDGNVLNAEITQSSGYEPFDKLSLKTIYLASPFPPIPNRLGHQKIRVNLSSYL